MTDTTEDVPITLHDGKATLHLGDCVSVCKKLAAEGVKVHSVVCDPPYEIGFMGRGWDSAGVAFDPETWKAIGEILLPGGHLLAFTSTRTYHRIACAIEDAGFEIRDQIQWLYGTGFPKNHDISKSIDRQTVRDLNGDLVFGRDWDRIYGVTNAIREARDAAEKTNRDIDERFSLRGMAGHWTAAETNTQPAIPQWDQWLELKQFLEMGEDEALDNEVWVLNGRKGQPGEGWTEREVLGTEITADALAWYAEEDRVAKEIEITKTNTDAAAEWEGWGTALKPANEPVVVARKPISEKTVAQNVVKHGTGAMNLDDSRIGMMGADDVLDPKAGRYPPNVILSHTEECVKVGSEKIDRAALRDFSGMDAYPAEDGEKRDNAEDSRNDTQKGKNFEILEIYECHDSCPVKKINETGDGSGRFFANMSPPDVVDLEGDNAPIVMARKPLDGTVAHNVLMHGVGGINIDGARIKSDSNPKVWETPRGGIWTTDSEAKSELVEDNRGRFPTNMILGSNEIVEAGIPDLDGENAPIVVARKPLSEKTVVENVLLHATGSMNIESARISHTDPSITRKDMESDTGEIFTGIGRSSNEAGPSSAGRFPSNIILGHSPDCLLVGERRVKTSTGTRGSVDNLGKEQGMFGMVANGQEVGYADPDGKETVGVWECVENCPVATIDEQSGMTTSAKPQTKGRSKNAPPSEIYGGGKGMAPKEGQVCPEYGDAGGASRYFKQIRLDNQPIGDWPIDTEIEKEDSQ